MKAVLFDLDGTLLPMDQDVFLKAYFGGLIQKLAPHGYDPEKLIKSIWAGTAAMVRNDGGSRNEAVFWKSFTDFFGEDSRRDESLFAEFYEREFQEVRKACGFEVRAKEVIRFVKESGCAAVLATNPLFPAIATESRIRWAGLDPADFMLYTTYENSSFCKPNPDYYREILEKLELDPSECLMVGNDAEEDTAAASLGIEVFLLTDCLINKNNADISALPHGGYSELMAFLKERLA